MFLERIIEHKAHDCHSTDQMSDPIFAPVCFLSKTTKALWLFLGKDGRKGTLSLNPGVFSLQKRAHCCTQTHFVSWDKSKKLKILRFNADISYLRAQRSY